MNLSRQWSALILATPGNRIDSGNVVMVFRADRDPQTTTDNLKMREDYRERARSAFGAFVKATPLFHGSDIRDILMYPPSPRTDLGTQGVTVVDGDFWYDRHTHTPMYMLHHASNRNGLYSIDVAFEFLKSAFNSAFNRRLVLEWRSFDRVREELEELRPGQRVLIMEIEGREWEVECVLSP